MEAVYGIQGSIKIVTDRFRQQRVYPNTMYTDTMHINIMYRIQCRHKSVRCMDTFLCAAFLACIWIQETVLT